MPDELILEKISFRVIIINQDSRKRESYRANLDNNNNEKNLQYLLKIVKIENISLLSDYIYTNVNKVKQNLYMKLISTINNIQIIATIVNDISQPILIFNL